MKLPEHVGAGAIDVEHAPDGSVLVSVPALPGLGYGSSSPIAASCRCGARLPPTVNAALTALYQRIATERVFIYGALAICSRCAKGN